MKELIRKLSSRKLWGCIIGIIVGLAFSFGVRSEDVQPIVAEVEKIAGMIGAIASCITYIVSEAKIDAASATNNSYLSQLASMFSSLNKPYEPPDLHGSSAHGIADVHEVIGNIGDDQTNESGDPDADA